MGTTFANFAILAEKWNFLTLLHRIALLTGVNISPTIVLQTFAYPIIFGINMVLRTYELIILHCRGMARIGAYFA
jgi:hypothetical protein